MDHDADINSKTKDGERILTKVCSLGHVHLLEFLIRTCGLNTEDKVSETNQLWREPGETGDIDVVIKLIDLNAQLTSSVLHGAAKYGQVNLKNGLWNVNR